MPDLRLTSTAFSAGDPIPTKYTCEGENVSPPLSWRGVPEGAESLALIVDDPDAPGSTFVHWVLYNLPTSQNQLPEAFDPETTFAADERPSEGRNGFGNAGYGGPCPPPGHGPHHYFFRLYALNTRLDLGPGTSKKGLTQAMDGHVLAETDLVGTYER